MSESLHYLTPEGNAYDFVKEDGITKLRKLKDVTVDDYIKYVEESMSGEEWEKLCRRALRHYNTLDKSQIPPKYGIKEAIRDVYLQECASDLEKAIEKTRNNIAVNSE